MLLGLKRQGGAGGEAENASEAAARSPPLAHPQTRRQLGEALGEVEVKAGASELGEGLAHS